MSKNYTFTGDLTSTIGVATKKTLIDKTAANTDEVKELLKGIPYLGTFCNTAGGYSNTYNADGTLNVTTLLFMPIGTITRDYNADGTINYIELILSDPVVATIRDTFAYNADGTILTKVRTVS